jgi:hypothetical protein
MSVSIEDSGLRFENGTPVIEGKIMETGDGTIILDKVINHSLPP